MSLNFKNLQKFIVVGDRVLIRPQEDSNKTSSGLYLPAGVAEKERIQSGYVIKVGQAMRHLRKMKMSLGNKMRNR
ncbi:MAG: co-chaperone GroES family protein [Ignavibacterium sp.]|nr:co-chaperone GroES family protein [Ignavibacterium sp.]